MRLNTSLIGEKDGDGPSHLVDRYEMASSGRGIYIYIYTRFGGGIDLCAIKRMEIADLSRHTRGMSTESVRG